MTTRCEDKAPKTIVEVQHCKLGSEKTFVACKFGEAVTMAEWRRSVKPLQRNTVGSNPTFPTELVEIG